ncbi:unnamed protein product [Cunninghamella echinulata]
MLISNWTTAKPVSFTTIKETNKKEQSKQKEKIRWIHAIDELLQTERDYNANLTYLVQVCFNKVLLQQQWISNHHKKLFIRNSDQLLAFHQQFLIKLEEANLEKDINLRCKNIATVFLDMGSNFTLYDNYCDKHDDTILLCNEYRSKPEWTIFTKECIAYINNGHIYPTTLESSFDQLTKPLHFEDYLIKPVQRVCRYQLLLKEILKYTTKETIEYKKLDCAIEMMKAIVAGIDHQKYYRDTTERTQLFIERLDLSDGQLNKEVIYQLGNLVVAGAIDVIYSSSSPSSSSLGSLAHVRSKYLGCFIFSTYLILVRPKKVTLYTPKYWFPLRHVELEDIQNNDQYENAFLLRYKNHMFIFTATCLREKKLWMKNLSQVIMEQNNKLNIHNSILTSSLEEIHRKSSLSKICPSRSVTNLLDFGRDNNNNSNSNIHHEACHPMLEVNLHPSYEKEMKKSKSIGSQLFNYQQQQHQNEFQEYHHDNKMSSSPTSPHPPLPTILPPSPPPSSSSYYYDVEDESNTIIPAITLTKRHSADFASQQKKEKN